MLFYTQIILIRMISYITVYCLLVVFVLVFWFHFIFVFHLFVFCWFHDSFVFCVCYTNHSGISSVKVISVVLIRFLHCFQTKIVRSSVIFLLPLFPNRIIINMNHIILRLVVSSVLIYFQIISFFSFGHNIVYSCSNYGLWFSFNCIVKIVLGLDLHNCSFIYWRGIILYHSQCLVCCVQTIAVSKPNYLVYMNLVVPRTVYCVWCLFQSVRFIFTLCLEESYSYFSDYFWSLLFHFSLVFQQVHVHKVVADIDSSEFFLFVSFYLCASFCSICAFC